MANEIGPIRLQASLGGYETTRRPDRNTQGFMVLAKVLKVHHKNHTLDVKFVEQGNTILGSERTEGRDTVKIVEAYAGFDPVLKKPYGNYTPYQVGMIVVVAYWENQKSRPMVLGAIHDFDNKKNVFPEIYPIPITDEEKLYESLKVTRAQDYFYQSGISDFELVHHSKAYIKGTGYPITDGREFGYENLTVKDKETKKTISQDEDEFRPLDYLVSLSEKYDESGNLLRVLASAENSTIRVLQDTVTAATYTEFKQDGSMSLKRQPTSNIPGSGEGAEILLTPDGTIHIRQLSAGSIITVGPDGHITITSANTTTVNASHINLNADTSISGNLSVSGSINASGNIIDGGRNTNHHTHPGLPG